MVDFGRVLRTGLSSLRDRATSCLAALRFNPSRIRAFVRKHPALTLVGGLMLPIILIDRFLGWHALAMVLALYLATSVADAWDEEGRPCRHRRAIRAEETDADLMEALAAADYSRLPEIGAQSRVAPEEDAALRRALLSSAKIVKRLERP